MKRAAPHENVRQIVIERIGMLLRGCGRDPSSYILHEVYVNERERIDVLVGDKVAVSLKGKKQEFPEAVREGEEKYLPHLPTVELYIVTDGSEWKLYKAEREEGKVRLKEIVSGDWNETWPTIQKYVCNSSIYPTVESISNHFKKLEALKDQLKEIFRENREQVERFFRSYVEIIKGLYGDAPDEEYLDLFVRHTLLQMAVLASLSAALNLDGSPVELAAGEKLDVDIAVPHLNWWRVAKGAAEVAARVVELANAVNWNARDVEDVFRELYELLVDQQTRVKIGEYYTPLWMVNYVLNHFSLSGKTVLDPFCGSGTFLVRAFHKKVDEGEDPDVAYNSVVGFDVNPLAVAVARSELVLAYMRRTRRSPSKPPRVYHVDTLRAWFLTGTEDPAYKDLWAVGECVGNLQSFDDLEGLEYRLSAALRGARMKCGERTAECLEKEIKRLLGGCQLAGEGVEAALGCICKKFANVLARRIAEYGNAMWASAVASVAAAKLALKLRPDVIVSNPPWIHITEFRARYADAIRGYLSNIIGGLGVRSTSVLNATDVAVAALRRALEVARDGVGFVVARDQGFNSYSPMPAGLAATYAVLRDVKPLKLVDIVIDAFGHGIPPSLIIARGAGEGLYRLMFKQRPQKTASFAEFEEEKIDVTYDEYIKPSLLYLGGSPEELARELGVVQVIPKGLYVMGILGGEKKKASKKYAGLSCDIEQKRGNVVAIKLHNTNSWIDLPENVLHDYGMRIYTLVYVGEIWPFKWRKPIQIILSIKGKDSTKKFLTALAGIVERGEDKAKIEELAKEVEHSVPEPLEAGYHYVVYRADRWFTATVVSPQSGNYLLDSHVSAIKCRHEKQAYYYAAVLNFLAYEAMSRGCTALHHAFARPLYLIVQSGLAWRDASWQHDVAVWSKMLSQKQLTYSSCKDQKCALKAVANHKEFKLIEQTLRKHITRPDFSLVAQCP